MSKTAETREDAGMFPAGIGGKLLYVGFSLNGEMLELSVYQKPKKLFYTVKKTGNKGRESAMNFHDVGHGFLDV